MAASSGLERKSLDDEDEDLGLFKGEDERRKRLRPQRWTEAEDARLCAAMLNYGESRWKEISQFVGTRNRAQCLQRWRNVVKPGLEINQAPEDEAPAPYCEPLADTTHIDESEIPTPPPSYRRLAEMRYCAWRSTSPSYTPPHRAQQLASYPQFLDTEVKVDHLSPS